MCAPSSTVSITASWHAAVLESDKWPARQDLFTNRGSSQAGMPQHDTDCGVIVSRAGQVSPVRVHTLTRNFPWTSSHAVVPVVALLLDNCMSEVGPASFNWFNSNLACLALLLLLLPQSKPHGRMTSPHSQSLQVCS